MSSVLCENTWNSQIISGVAINILALNATTFLLRRVFNQADPPREAWERRLPAT